MSFALFADAANLSQEGKLNVLGVFDALQVATSWATWESLRTEVGVDVHAARDAVLALVTNVLCATPHPAGRCS